MTRTFSLARLMIGITAFGIVCGVAVNYPVALLVFVVSAIPPAFVWTALVVLFHHKTGATVAALLAAPLA